MKSDSLPLKVYQLPQIPRSNNFDFLRFLLAFSVFICHFPTLTGVALSSIGAPFGLIATFAVRCFFVISGFLIFMSYENSKSLREYCLKRINRIYPAYCFIIFATAFGLFFLSSFSWKNYFLRPEFFKYIFFNLAFASNIQQSLPGVFTENHSAVVNGPLWTIKIEILFYASVPILVFLLRRFNRLASIGLIYVFSYLYFVGMSLLFQKTGSAAFEQLSRQLPGQLSFFLSGALLYYYFNVFKKYAFLFFGIAVTIFVVQRYLPETNFVRPEVFMINLLLPLSLGIIIVFIAFFTPQLSLFSKYGDFSYGIYIFHFPILQILTALKFYSSFPSVALLATVFIVFGCAAVSWNFIEKPFLYRKNHYRVSA